MGVHLLTPGLRDGSHERTAGVHADFSLGEEIAVGGRIHAARYELLVVHRLDELQSSYGFGCIRARLPVPEEAAASPGLPLETSANCLSQNAAMGIVISLMVCPGFSVSNVFFNSVRNGLLFGSPHMKLGQLNSAVLPGTDQTTTAAAARTDFARYLIAFSLGS